MKKATTVTAVLLAVSIAVIVAVDAFRSKPVTNSFFSMNTFVSAEVESENGEECLEKIKQTVENLDYNLLSRTAKSSTIYSLNKNGETALDEKMSSYFSSLYDVSVQSGGAFDFSLGAVSDLWDFGGTPSVPDEEALKNALSHSGYDKILIKNNTATLIDKNAVVDFGASGKGIALDEIRECLDLYEAKRAVISVGGSVLLYGDGDFTVGIRNPRGDSASTIATLTLSEGCVSTSGSYERCFEENGKNYHHILNSETGFPVDNGLMSVTVISESGLLSDALSTACFVLGIEEGSKLAEHYGAKVIFITEDNVVYTDSATRALINLTDSSYSVAEDAI